MRVVNRRYSIRSVLMAWSALAICTTALLLIYFMYQSMDRDFHQRWRREIHTQTQAVVQQLQYNLNNNDWRLADKNIGMLATYSYISHARLVFQNRIVLSTRRAEINEAVNVVTDNTATIQALGHGEHYYLAHYPVNIQPPGQRHPQTAMLLLDYDVSVEHDQMVQEMVIRTAIILVVLLLYTTGLSQLLRRQLLQPLEHLQDLVKQLRDGNLGHTTSLARSHEFGELEDAFNQLSEHLQQSLQQIHRQHAVNTAFSRAFPDVAFLVDDQGRIQERLGNRASQITGRTDPVIGEYLWRWISDPYQQASIRECWQRAMNNDVMIREEIVHKGQYLDSRMTHIPVEQRTEGQVSVLWLLRDITELRQKQQEVEYQAHYDSLTGLANRRSAINSINATLGQTESRYGAIMFIDLDHFKSVNDSLGHGTGDALLIEVSLRIQKIASTRYWTAARLGGDEFLLISKVQENTLEASSERAASIAEELLEQLALPYLVGPHWLHLSASIGIATYFCGCQDAANILRQADTAMYYAKGDGRNRWRRYDQSMQQETQQRLQLLNDLHEALRSRHLSLAFQPQLNSEGELIGAESLCRWINRGVAVNPEYFIALAEEVNLITPLGDWVFESSCQWLADWQQRQLLPPTFQRLAINVSPSQLMDPGLPERMAVILERFGVDADRIELEITEGVFLRRYAQSGQRLQELVDMGFTLALDDFGTGYSSLSYLQTIPLHKLKIDRGFVLGIQPGNQQASIVDAIIRLGKGLGLSIVAEGVETPSQFQYLREHDCSQYQGYLFSKPLAPELFEDYLLQHLP